MKRLAGWRSPPVAAGAAVTRRCAHRAGGSRTLPDPDSVRFEGQRPVAVLEGQATYYSDSFAGNDTSNGEPYDLSLRTAASRDLPFGSVLRVTRRDTGAHVLVHVIIAGLSAIRAAFSISRTRPPIDRHRRPRRNDVRAEVLDLGPKRTRRRRKRSEEIIPPWRLRRQERQKKKLNLVFFSLAPSGAVAVKLRSSTLDLPSRLRAISMRWTSLVPSPMRVTRTSRT